MRHDTILQLAEGRELAQVLDVALPSGGYVYVDFDSHLSTAPNAATAFAEAQNRSRSLRGVAFGRHPDGGYMTSDYPPPGAGPVFRRVDGETFFQASLEVVDGEVLLGHDEIRGERAPTVPGLLRHRFEMVDDFVVEHRWSHRSDVSEFDARNGPTQAYLQHIAARIQDVAIAACGARLSNTDEARVAFLDLAPESVDVFDAVFSAGVSEDMCRPGSRGLLGVFQVALSAKHADILQDAEDDFALRYARRYHRLDYIATNVMQDRWIETILAPENDQGGPRIQELLDRYDVRYRDNEIAIREFSQEMERTRAANANAVTLANIEALRLLEVAKIEATSREIVEHTRLEAARVDAETKFVQAEADVEVAARAAEAAIVVADRQATAAVRQAALERDRAIAVARTEVERERIRTASAERIQQLQTAASIKTARIERKGKVLTAALEAFGGVRAAREAAKGVIGAAAAGAPN